MGKTFPSRPMVWLAAVVLADLLLLTPSGSVSRVAGAMLLLLLPGLSLVAAILSDVPWLLRQVIGLGTSIALVQILVLLLHYLPGPLPLWAELGLLNLVAAAPVLLREALTRPSTGTPTTVFAPAGQRAVVSLLVMATVLGLGLRVVWLDYSEFQGDESLVMITAAEVIEGHPDALWLRGKGPGEVLLPVALWRLTGTINEGAARLPFAVAACLVPVVGFLLATHLFGLHRSGYAPGMATAILLAVNGFMVAFGRIVQYQSLVVLMSGLALLCTWHWQRDQGGVRWLVWCGLFLGAGLLAHYDTLLVMPAVAYLIGRGVLRAGRSAVLRSVVAVLFGGLVLVVSSGLFYAPYLLDAQASRTGSYLGDRIGDQILKNNLDGFQQLNVFYTSFYYYVLTGLLVLAWLAWASRRAPFVRRLPRAGVWLPAVLVLATLGTAIWPHTLRTPAVDLAAVPSALLLVCAVLSADLDHGRRAAVLWLAVPFLGYNFAVARPLTHIYTIVPAWTLLAGLAIGDVAPCLARRRGIAWLAGVGAAGIVALFAGYDWLAYLRHDVEFRQDWPRSRAALYWTPYSEPPATGYFGFPHRAGWKAVGALYTSGDLVGDYGSNEEPDVTAWYTRGATRACDTRPTYYFMADTLVDPWPVDASVIQDAYDVAGVVTLPNGRGLTIYQARPMADRLGSLDHGALEVAFDATATSDAFARGHRGAHEVNANLGGLVRLVGYDLDARRATPGGRLSVTLYWQPLQALAGDYHVFVHLEAGAVRSQADGRPVCWTYPTTDWRPGQIIADHYAVAILPETPPGHHPLRIGMYDPTDGRRLDVLDAEGRPTDNAVWLEDVMIR